MPYVSSVERLAREEGREEGRQEGREEGREEGLQEAVLLALEAKFGAAGTRLARKVHAIHDLDRLRAFAQAIGTVETLTEIKALLGRQTGPVS